MTEPKRSPDDRYPLAGQALATFGERAQLLALSEELSEASAAIARYLNDKGDANDVLTELVDFESVTASLRDVLGDMQTWDAVRQAKRVKLAAVLQRGDARTRDANHG